MIKVTRREIIDVVNMSYDGRPEWLKFLDQFFGSYNEVLYNWFGWSVSNGMLLWMAIWLFVIFSLFFDYVWSGWFWGVILLIMLLGMIFSIFPFFLSVIGAVMAVGMIVRLLSGCF